MPRPRVYVETTIPSAYYDRRKDPYVVARRESTRRWWAAAVLNYELVTSPIVHDELRRGPSERNVDWLKLLEGIALVTVEPRLDEIVHTYIRQRLMPARPDTDAFHLALASYHKCDFLVTWDRRHLANPNKFRHIRKVNLMLGLFVPAIVTPQELLEEDHGSS